MNPTFSPSVNNLGRSCMRPSNLVGDLNLVLASSAYLGLTNSGIKPFVLSNTFK